MSESPSGPWLVHDSDGGIPAKQVAPAVLEHPRAWPTPDNAGADMTKTNTSADTRPTFRPDEELVHRARVAVESAITNLSVIRSEPDAGDVASGERSAWLLDDLLTVRLQLELLDDAPELQGGIPHAVGSADSAQIAENSHERVAGEPCPDCSKPLGTNRACPYWVADVLRSQTPEPQMADAIPAEFRDLFKVWPLPPDVVVAIQRLQPRSDTTSQPKTAANLRRPCDHRDADAYLAKGEEALAVALEVDGSEFIDDESGALLSRSLTRAWSAVRMARLELRGPVGGDQ